MSSSHQHAVAANSAAFQKMADEYDKREFLQVVSYLLAGELVQFDPTVAADARNLEAAHGAALASPIGSTDPLASSMGIDTGVLPAEAPPTSVFTKQARVMDFACGSGLVTEKLVPYVCEGEVVGVDISKEFMAHFVSRSKRWAQEHPQLTVSSHVVDVLDPALALQTDQWAGYFDVVVCTLAYHHLHDLDAFTKRLAGFVRPGGWLLIVDFYNPDVEAPRSLAGVLTGVEHMGGLANAKMVAGFEAAGLVLVLSGPVFLMKAWMAAEFIKTHSKQEDVDKMGRGELPQRQRAAETEYLVEVPIMLAAGQAP